MEAHSMYWDFAILFWDWFCSLCIILWRFV